MRLPLKWEFPGGKVEAGETEEDCIIREIQEELNIQVRVLSRMEPCTYKGEGQEIRLIPFSCMVVAGEIKLAEHAAFKWLSAEKLMELDWAPADVEVLQNYLESLKGT